MTKWAFLMGCSIDVIINLRLMKQWTIVLIIYYIVQKGDNPQTCTISNSPNCEKCFRRSSSVLFHGSPSTIRSLHRFFSTRFVFADGFSSSSPLRFSATNQNLFMNIKWNKISYVLLKVVSVQSFCHRLYGTIISLFHAEF